jgi:adenosylhomocysteine nucleosidase
MKVFIIALQSEAEPVLAHLTQKTERTVCEKKVISGLLSGEPVAIVVCGVGKVNAACGAQYAVDVLQADTLINLGVAGGLNDGVKVGQIYAIKSAVEYDFDLVQLNHTPIGTLNEYSSRYLPLTLPKGFEPKVLGTGDRFNDSPDDFNLLTKEIGCDIRDMEGAAMVHVALHAGVTVYSFKCISDIAGSGSTTEQFLANMQLCAKNMTEQIPHIMEAIRG